MFRNLVSTLADTTTEICAPEPGKCTSILPQSWCESGGGIWSILQTVLDIMTAGIAVLAVVSIVISGIQWLTARDNESQIVKAKSRIFNVAIGIVTWALMWLILSWLIPDFNTSSPDIVAPETSPPKCIEVPSQVANDPADVPTAPLIDPSFSGYNQFDPAWANEPYNNPRQCPSKTISSSGCGPTAIATIITVLTGRQVKPPEIASLASSRGYYICEAGSAHAIGEIVADYGLKYDKPTTAQTVTQVNEQLRKGKMFFISGAGNNPFTPGGHFIVVRGITENGRWLIYDSNGSNGQANFKKDFDAARIRKDYKWGGYYIYK